MTGLEIIQHYKDLYDSLTPKQDFEKIACVLYISIFEKLNRKARLNKAKDYIFREFSIQDRKRLDFVYDEMWDDAYLCNQIQQAYILYWTKVLGLPQDLNVTRNKFKATSIGYHRRYPHYDLSPPNPMNYIKRR